MVSSRLKISFLSALLMMAAGAAQAADYSPPCYDAALIAAGRAPYGAVPCYVPPQPVEVEEFSGWYLRGDIGVTNQSVKNLENALSVTSSTDVGFGFDASPLVGLGVGYYVNDWLRFDATGEYRSKANFHGSQIVTSGGNTYTDEYSGSKSEWLFLLNGYVDLGTWQGFTPFVGAGVGAARNTIHSFQDVNTTCYAAASPLAIPPRSGTSPGRCMPVSPTKCRRISPSNSPIVMSISAMPRPVTSTPITAPITFITRWNSNT